MDLRLATLKAVFFFLVGLLSISMLPMILCLLTCFGAKTGNNNREEERSQEQNLHHVSRLTVDNIRNVSHVLCSVIDNTQTIDFK
jgi:hypothetical protein